MSRIHVFHQPPEVFNTLENKKTQFMVFQGSNLILVGDIVYVWEHDPAFSFTGRKKVYTVCKCIKDVNWLVKGFCLLFLEPIESLESLEFKVGLKERKAFPDSLVSFEIICPLCNKEYDWYEDILFKPGLRKEDDHEALLHILSDLGVDFSLTIEHAFYVPCRCGSDFIAIGAYFDGSKERLAYFSIEAE